jgi:hypothetical protein
MRGRPAAADPGIEQGMRGKQSTKLVGTRPPLVRAQASASVMLGSFAASVRSWSVRLVLSGFRLFVGRIQGLTRRFGALAVEELEACRATIAPQNQEPFVDLADSPAVDLIADAHPHDLIAGHVMDHGA